MRLLPEPDQNLTDSLIECISPTLGSSIGMSDRKQDMDAVRSAEFKEAFDEFDKVRGELVEERERERR